MRRVEQVVGRLTISNRKLKTKACVSREWSLRDRDSGYKDPPLLLVEMRAVLLCVLEVLPHLKDV